MTKSVRAMAKSRPKATDTAMGDRISEPSDVERAMGSSPAMVVMEVMSMGRSRTVAPSMTARDLSMPFLRILLM